MGGQSNALMDYDYGENKERIANMIHEGGLGTMSYYNYELNQDKPQQLNTPNNIKADQKS